MDKYQNKYRSESHRLQGWDYSSEGIYFITICTQDRVHLFGEIVEAQMIANDYGEIVIQEIENSINIRDKWIFHEWVLMPNHIHLLIEIEESDNVDTPIDNTHLVDTHRSAYLQNDTSVTHHSAYRPKRKPKSISSFVAQFKAVCTKRINELRKITGERVWQRNYHDHIVRNYQSFCNIANYIRTNPEKWQTDRFNPENKEEL